MGDETTDGPTRGDGSATDGTVGGRDGGTNRGMIVGIVLTSAVICALLVLFAAFVMGPLNGITASHEDHAIRLTLVVFMMASAPVMAVVWGIGLYGVFAWRNRSRSAPKEDGPPIRNNAGVVGVWLGLTVALALFLVIWGLGELQATNASAEPGALNVNVTGNQWVWSFDYPAQHVESGDLVLPINRQVVFHVTSADVVHGFWIYNFGIKVDANPGVTTMVRTTPTRLGTYPVRCAELCGLYHSYMETSVHVVTPQQFNAWVQAGGGPAPTG